MARLHYVREAHMQTVHGGLCVSVAAVTCRSSSHDNWRKLHRETAA